MFYLHLYKSKHSTEKFWKIFKFEDSWSSRTGRGTTITNDSHLAALVYGYRYQFGLSFTYRIRNDFIAALVKDQDKLKQLDDLSPKVDRERNVIDQFEERYRTMIQIIVEKGNEIKTLNEVNSFIHVCVG